MRDEWCTSLWAQQYINGIFLLLWSFSRIHVMHFPLESQESLESMESQVLGHFSSVWYGSHLMELAYNQIKYGWLSHNIYVTILQIYLTNRAWLQLARFVTGWSSQLLFCSSSLPRMLVSSGEASCWSISSCLMMQTSAIFRN